MEEQHHQLRHEGSWRVTRGGWGCINSGLVLTIKQRGRRRSRHANVMQSNRLSIINPNSTVLPEIQASNEMDTSSTPLSFKLSPPEPQSQAPKAQPLNQQHYTTTLHSIKKQPVKPWRRPEQLPPRVYSVEPRGFRKLVQRLTGKPPRQARPRLLRDTLRMPPPPLELAPRSLPQPQMQSVGYHNASSIQTQLELSVPFPAMANLQSPNGFMGFISQPFYSGWCLSPLLSPGTLAAMDQGTS